MGFVSRCMSNDRNCQHIRLILKRNINIEASISLDSKHSGLERILTKTPDFIPHSHEVSMSSEIPGLAELVSFQVHRPGESRMTLR